MKAIRQDLNVNFKCFMDYKGIKDGEEVSAVDFIFFIEAETANYCKQFKIAEENIDKDIFSEWLQERHLRSKKNAN